MPYNQSFLLIADLFTARNDFRDGVSQLVEIMVNDEDEDVCLAGFGSLTNLGTKSGMFMQLHLINPVLTAFSDIIQPFIESELKNKFDKLISNEQRPLRDTCNRLLSILLWKCMFCEKSCFHGLCNFSSCG